MPGSNDLKNINKLLIIISKINQQLVTSNNEKKLCQKICNYLVQIKDYKLLWLDLRDINNNITTLSAIAGDQKDFIDGIKDSWDKYGFTGNSVTKAFKSGNSFLIEDLTNKKIFSPWERVAVKKGLKSAVTLPLKYYSEVIGSLHIYSDIKNHFTKEEVKFLNEVAGDISIGIKNIRNEKKILQKGKEYENLFNNLLDGFAIHEILLDKDNKPVDYIFLDVNPAFEKLTSLKRKEILGKKVTEVIPGINRDPADWIGKYGQVCLTGKESSFEQYSQQLGKWYRVKAFKSGISKFATVFEDITERKKAEEELTLANDCLVMAQKSAGAGLWDWDMNTEKLTWSDEFYILFGLDPIKDNANFDTWRMVLHPQDRQKAGEEINRSIEEKKPLFNEYRIILPSGKIRWINALGDTEYDKQGKAAKMSGICIDITERKNIQEDLDLSENRYHNLFENMLEGYSYCRMFYGKDGLPCDWTYLDINKQFEALTGLKDVINKKVTEVLPGIREANPELLEIYGRVALTGKPESFEDYIIPLNIWLHISVFSPKKEHFISVFHNVTEVHEFKEGIIKNLKNTRKALKNTIDSLASIVEIKDPYTSGHQDRVKQLSVAIAKEMGLDRDIINAISTASILHDIGKVMIPASILAKPTSLTELEFAMIKTHSKSGYDIIKKIDFGYPVADIVMQHHERLDGSGYPSGLKENKIMIEAKIIAVSDVVEGMSSHRPYRSSVGIEKALDEIESNKNTLYDPTVVDACVRLINKKGFKFK